MQPVEWNDHEFAAWLRKQDPNWDWYPLGDSNVFTANGRNVAVAIYDNAQCTRKIFIQKEA